MSEPQTRVRVKRGTAPQHLVNAAQGLFIERGYRATTTKDIAQAAGVSENLIFRYFGSKSELMVVSVITPLLEVLEHFRSTWRQTYADTEKPVRELVRSFVGELVDLIHTHDGLVRATVGVVAERPADFDNALLSEQFAAVLNGLTPETTDFLTRGRLSSSDPRHVLRMGVIAAVSNVVLFPESFGPAEQRPTREVLVDDLTNFIVYGLQQAPAPPNG